MSIALQYESLRNNPLQPEAWLAMAQSYAKSGLIWPTYYALRQVVRFKPELRIEANAVQATLPQALDEELLLRLPDTKLGQTLIAAFEEAVRYCPQDWLSWLYLARLYMLVGNAKRKATAALKQAQDVELIPGESLHWMGVWSLRGGDPAGAVVVFAKIRETYPKRYGSLIFLADALMQKNDIAEAEVVFELASHAPNAMLLTLLADTMQRWGYREQAVAVRKRAVELSPQDAASWLSLGRAEYGMWQWSGARDSLSHVKEIAPDTDVDIMLALLHGWVGDMRTQLQMMTDLYKSEERQAESRLVSSIAMSTLYYDGWLPEKVARLHRQMCVPIEKALPRKRLFNNEKNSKDKNSKRRLRVAYVTGDLCGRHPVQQLLMPVLRQHDKSQFEVAVYYTGAVQDAFTQQAKALCERWVDAATLDDSTLRNLIERDGVDILVDLAGHTESHRLGVFVMGAAPIQVSFLGYPHSTGLTSIDWLVADAVVAPPEHETLFSEKVARLPHSVFCWEPQQAFALPMAKPEGAPVIFGSFNHSIKLSPTTIALWAKVLQAVPDSRLLLKAPALGDTAVREHFIQAFGKHGVATSRLIMQGPSDLNMLMQTYSVVDIALDPTPYNGGVTTLQALWMGVPVVTLQGGSFQGRMGASILNAIGHEDWIAQDKNTYVQIAQKLAQHVRDVRQGREALRQRMQNSALCDAAAYTQYLEALYEKMWYAWVGK